MEIRKTDDGSSTIWSEKYGETYHSGFGAVTESTHVFIEAGLKQAAFNPVNVFEMGFGSGLNALLTFIEATKLNLIVNYHAIELHPLNSEFVDAFDVPHEYKEVFNKIHAAEWNKETAIDANFTIKKIQGDLTLWQPDSLYHLVYYDAFSPESQPELWTVDIFRKIYDMMYPGGILTTYCAKGIVRRNMIATGFIAERLPGPPGKREMLRARKS
ncbi:MAG TPA: tRNA (5-methylaminomethyl-2-thiouridine)(34)-methyltransferase MnmD [Bacteroidales bacterium]|nr:tRNA (5-methylaminomethyl-2-thiouridine)(34)-methyltransferase MnmD [Bacteroidales bacterium]